MKKTLTAKHSLIAIFTLIVLFLVTLFFVNYRSMLITKQLTNTQDNYNLFVTEVESKLQEKLYDIVTNNYDESKIETIDINNNLKINEDELKPIQLNSLNNILENNDDNILKIIVYHNNKLYLDDEIRLYNDEFDTNYFITKDKQTITSASGNRLFPIIDMALIANINDDKPYNIRTEEKEFLNIKYFDEYNIYLAQLSPKTLIDDIEIFTYATIISIITIISLLIYLFSTRNNKTDNTHHIEQFLSGYENLYYIITDSKFNIIKTNDLINQNFNDDQILNIIQDFKENKDNLEFEITNNDKIYKFKKLVFYNNLLFVSENYTNIIMEQNQKIYNNKRSNLPNYYSLEQFIYSTSIRQKSSLVLFSIKNIKNIITFDNETNSKLISTIKNQFNKYSKANNSMLFHLKSDLFVILIKHQHVLENDTKFIEENLDELKKDLLKETNISFEFVVGVINVDHEVITENIILKNIIDTVLDVGYKFDGNKIVFYNKELKDNLILSESIKIDLEKAIQNKEFVMYLQPIHSFESNKTIKYESLLRWNNEKYINMSPLTYINIAEEHELIYELGYIVIEESVKLAARIEDKEITITINVSPKELGNLGFANKLLSEIKKNNVKPNQIGIEITETSLIEATTHTLENIHKIRNKGIKIYLDDFGTGYSSLNNLRDFPVDYIKIDRSFIRNMDSNIADEKITSSLIGLAQSLNLKVIAEGVETNEQSDKLRAMGCKLIQGYYLSQPKPFDEIFKQR